MERMRSKTGGAPTPFGRNRSVGLGKSGDLAVISSRSGLDRISSRMGANFLTQIKEKLNLVGILSKRHRRSMC